MSWIALSLLSAFFLGLYDIAKKTSVRDNAVPPVLLVSVITAAAIWCSVLLSRPFLPTAWAQPLDQVFQLSTWQHWLLAAKSALVGASWTLAFFSLKHLPISIASPIRATSPLWTVLAAIALMGERPTAIQLTGMVVVVCAFVLFSRIGQREGIHFRRDRWVGAMILATILGASSALYDKYLLQSELITPICVQAWFSIYLVPVMLPMATYWYCKERKSNPFRWRYSIPMIAILLLVTDLVYFTAISMPDALISVISPIRRTSVVVPFAFGIVILGERNWRVKALCIVAILVGVYMLSS
ncbi:MAG: DMT family transporter [Aureliella sp.]